MDKCIECVSRQDAAPLAIGERWATGAFFEQQIKMRNGAVTALLRYLRHGLVGGDQQLLGFLQT